MPSTKLANRYEARVLDHPKLQTLSRQDQQALLSIVKILRDGPEALRLHYLPQLVVLLETPYVKRGRSNPEERDVHRRVNADLRTYRDQVTAGAIDPTREENLSAGARNFVRRVGHDGKTFLVDATRLDAVVVKVKVKFNFVHCDEMRTKIPTLEDAIEKACRARGYDVDLVLTQRSGPDVFEVNVDDQKWADAGNFAGGAETLAHELHHLLGLDDRYDRALSHAGNEAMQISDRLYWIREEIPKPLDRRHQFSKMADNSQPVLAEDVCAVVGDDSDECRTVRSRLDPPGLPELPPGFSPHRRQP